MTIESHGHEHELEPEYGLPEPLPKGERLLWQGSPQFAAVAQRVFHLRTVALYFAALLAWRAGGVMADGGSAWDAFVSLALPSGLALLGLAALAVLAWLTARTAVYTVTDKRLVMRIGVVLTLTFNVPYTSIRSAAVRASKDSQATGDIVVDLSGPDHIAWLHLWPHSRPWHMAKPQPMLRCVPQAAAVAQILTTAWAQATGHVAAVAQPERQALTSPAPTKANNHPSPGLVGVAI